MDYLCKYKQCLYDENMHRKKVRIALIPYYVLDILKQTFLLS